MSYQEPKEKKNDRRGIMFFKKLITIHKWGCISSQLEDI